MLNEGVMLLFYDLPMLCKEERKEYTRFRNEIKKSGYIQIQESVYVKHLRNVKQGSAEKQRVRRIVPDKGNFMFFEITMKQYKSISVLGDKIDLYDKLFQSVVKL